METTNTLATRVQSVDRNGSAQGPLRANQTAPESKAAESNAAPGAERPTEAASTVSISNEALSQVRAANLSAAAAATLGENSVEAAAQALEGAALTGRPESVAGGEPGGSTPISGGAAELSIGQEARRMAQEKSTAEAAGRALSVERPADSAETSNTAFATETAQEPGTSADQLGVVADAGSQ